MPSECKAPPPRPILPGRLALPADDAIASGVVDCRRRPATGHGEGAIPVTIPNLITIGRLLLVPLIVWLIIAAHPTVAFWVFVAAGISDGVDGFIARQFNLRSDLGAYLDPLADKALLVSIYVAFAVFGEIPVWVTILVVSRDFLIVGGVVLAWMVGQPMAMRPAAISKVNTVAQITLAAIVLGDLAFSIDLGTLRTGLNYLVGISTIASAALYLVDWVRHMGRAAAGGPIDRTREDSP
jgi:cardiolipin synthase